MSLFLCFFVCVFVGFVPLFACLIFICLFVRLFVRLLVCLFAGVFVWLVGLVFLGLVCVCLSVSCSTRFFFSYPTASFGFPWCPVLRVLPWPVPPVFYPFFWARVSLQTQDRALSLPFFGCEGFPK